MTGLEKFFVLSFFAFEKGQNHIIKIVPDRAAGKKDVRKRLPYSYCRESAGGRKQVR